jgi:cysteine desulfurase/selenocysteine lyase
MSLAGFAAPPSTAPRDWLADFPAIPAGWAYLDSAATAQKPKAVIDAIARAYGETYATVHRGVYQRSAEMTLAFEASRRRVAEFINACAPEEIVFVRGATEGINLVAQSWGREHLKPGDRMLLSALEHTATSCRGSSLAQGSMSCR